MKEKIKLIEEHLLKHNRFITVIMEGKINGKRPRISFFEELFQRVGFISYQQFKKIASDRHE